MRRFLLAALLLIGSPLAAQGPAPVALYRRTARPAISTTHLMAQGSRPKASNRPNLTAGLLGFVVGGVAGAAVGCALNNDDYGVFCGGQDDTRVVVSGAIGGLVVGTAAALLFGRRE
jgi:membrane associated rhomboid family serine protease